ncbi:tumor necrosis factor receptor superfamily member 14-like isoform X2 [Cheilinus undulatus]|uniref:tumor necrosis factor receptor superfamily member 14-like isoform X2 n=1 Tax=Cheilinus undulatus TaxID=241271 RepID=UPI001BD31F18|nr:tumor necrosis factor receptor superfamily member 14-like isoform X2 [Cheilinus undulatus]
MQTERVFLLLLRDAVVVLDHNNLVILYLSDVTSSLHENQVLIYKITLINEPCSIMLLMIFMMNMLLGGTLTCHRTEYVFGNECCPMCPVGNRVKTDCEVYKSTSCQPCSEGTFMNKLNGLKSCLPCSWCEADSGLKIKSACTKSSDTVCEPQEGFYCIESAEEGCSQAKKHRSCEPGEYIRERGTSTTDTLCSPCSAGTFSDGTLMSCQTHRQCESENRYLLRPGTDSEDAECGGLQSDRTVPIAVGVGGVFLCIAFAVGVIWFLIKKKKPRSPKSGADIEPMNVSQGVASNGDVPPDMATGNGPV